MSFDVKVISTSNDKKYPYILNVLVISSVLTSCPYFIFVDGNCGSNWKCSDNMCIARDLHCDKVAHCLDVSDEVVNCSNSGLYVQVP